MIFDIGNSLCKFNFVRPFVSPILKDLLKNWVAEGVASKVNDSSI